MSYIKDREFLECLGKVEQALSNYTLSLCKNSFEAQDLLQDTIYACFESFEKLKDKSKFKPYIFQIASRLYKRMIWRKRLFFEYDEGAAEIMPDEAHDLNLSHEIADMYNAMNELSIDQREAITLFEISGFSISEIAKIQNSKENTVKSRLKRARAKLAEILSAEYSSAERIECSRRADIKMEVFL
jgi:RNA polymerase sigma-70 factor (ECF subfamily)